MTPLPSFMKGLFRRRTAGGPGTDAKAGRAEVPRSEPADPALEVLRGKIVMKFSDFMIAVPQGSPTCAVCARPTYSQARNEGQIVLPEGSEKDIPLQQKAGKALVFAAGAVCQGCKQQLCWRCIVTVGLGACPKCHQCAFHSS